MSKKVYVTQAQERFNLLPALQFGELDILYPAGQAASFSPGTAVTFLKQKLQHYTSEDYLLLIGDPVLIGITIMVASYWANGHVKLLKWDRQERKYYPVEVKL